MKSFRSERLDFALTRGLGGRHFSTRPGAVLPHVGALMMSNIFYQSASINFNKDKKEFAFAVIIIKQLLIFNEH